MVTLDNAVLRHTGINHENLPGLLRALEELDIKITGIGVIGNIKDVTIMPIQLAGKCYLIEPASPDVQLDYLGLNTLDEKYKVVFEQDEQGVERISITHPDSPDADINRLDLYTRNTKG